MSLLIQTYSGKTFDLLNPDPFLIDISDIAHSLSMQCRFGGHSKEFYSVANHCLLVSLNVPEEDAMAGLLHDATEAYCQDIISPLKSYLPQYKNIEEGIWEAIAYKYKLPETLPRSVKNMDCAVSMTEIRDLITGKPQWINPEPLDIEYARPLKIHIHPFTQSASRHTFLKQFHYLKGKYNAKK